MIGDRHAVLRLAAQAVVPLGLLLGAGAAVRLESGLGAPIGAALTLVATLMLFALVFGFRALGSGLPMALARLTAALSAAVLLAVGLLARPDVFAAAEASEPMDRLLMARLLGGLAVLALASGLLAIVHALGARPRRLEDPKP